MNVVIEKGDAILFFTHGSLQSTGDMEASRSDSRKSCAQQGGRATCRHLFFPSTSDDSCTPHNQEKKADTAKSRGVKNKSEHIVHIRKKKNVKKCDQIRGWEEKTFKLSKGKRHGEQRKNIYFAPLKKKHREPIGSE
jgi:hypothetical protein